MKSILESVDKNGRATPIAFFVDHQKALERVALYKGQPLLVRAREVSDDEWARAMRNAKGAKRK